MYCKKLLSIQIFKRLQLKYFLVMLFKNAYKLNRYSIKATHSSHIIQFLLYSMNIITN